VNSDPQVSFVVPCYKYAHYLAECVNSILAQTFGDFEVIIMDDCSPDNTPEVAASFKDPRVLYVRQERNVGAVANINDGIRRARGTYVWVLSADDLLARNDALSDYVAICEKYPEIGMVHSTGCLLGDEGVLNKATSPQTEVSDDGRWRVIVNSRRGDCDQVLAGKEFFVELGFLQTAFAYRICPPTIMFRASCFPKAGLWPADTRFRYCPDWLLWARFAFHFDVGYIAKPGACYRIHSDSEYQTYSRERGAALCACSLNVLWEMLSIARGDSTESRIRDGIVCYLNKCLEHALCGDETSLFRMTPAEVLEAIAAGARDPREADEIRRRVFRDYADCCSSLGQRYSREGDSERARSCYAEAIKWNRLKVKTWMRLFFLSLPCRRRNLSSAGQPKD
jgi:glycosyltransferase involved in cell wall biosynthesis